MVPESRFRPVQGCRTSMITAVLLLNDSGYDRGESEFLIKRFTEGFDIGYRGPQQRQRRSKNIPFSVGNKVILWNKIMKEVKEGCYAGPFDKVPYENFIQSPIGLVPKAGNKTRLIFHLSFEFKDKQGKPEGSINKCTLREWCTVHYMDLDDDVANYLKLSEFTINDTGDGTVFLGKTDLTSAFHVLPLRVDCFCWLIMQAEDPVTGEMKFFVEKCLPFGSSISCSHYQRFSNALKHITQWRTGSVGKAITNYLDDFLFIAIAKLMCNGMIMEFLNICKQLNLPVALEKTEWSSTLIVFLGILLDGRNLILALPLEKQRKALNLLNDIRDRKKSTVKHLQVLTGYLNFLTKAIFTGRTFTRRMYNKFADCNLKLYHHVRLDAEFKLDCEIWRTLLLHYENITLCRAMVDLNRFSTSTQLLFFSDASTNPELGASGVFNKKWWFVKWEPGFVNNCKASIEYLELFGLVASILTFGHLIRNMRIVIFCNNQSVMHMVNSITSSCKNCMFLLRLLALNNLVNNRRVFIRHVRSEHNGPSDALSRLQFQRFWNITESMERQPKVVSLLIWPLTKIWQKL